MSQIQHNSTFCKLTSKAVLEKKETQYRFKIWQLRENIVIWNYGLGRSSCCCQDAPHPTLRKGLNPKWCSICAVLSGFLCAVFSPSFRLIHTRYKQTNKKDDNLFVQRPKTCTIPKTLYYITLRTSNRETNQHNYETARLTAQQQIQPILKTHRNAEIS